MPLNGTFCDFKYTETKEIMIMNRDDNIRKDAETDVFSSLEMREPAPAEVLPKHKTPAEIA